MFKEKFKTKKGLKETYNDKANYWCIIISADIF